MQRLIWFVCLFCCLHQGKIVAQVNLFPKPTLVKTLPGSLTLYGDLVVDSTQLPDGGTVYLNWVAERIAKRCVNYSTIGAQVRFQRMFNALPNSYTISINRTIDIAYTTPASCMHAISSLMQLMEVCVDRLELPRCFIQDSPMYAFRGLQIDACSRFYAVDEMKQLLQVMALYKLTHLTWKLADNNVIRIPLIGDSVQPKFDKCYSKQELLEVATYARNLQIELVPEIDLLSSATRLCDKFELLTCEKSSRNSNEVEHFRICAYEPAREQLKRILAEFLPVFSSGSWSLGRMNVQCVSNRDACKRCQKVMREEGFSDPQQLIGFIYEDLSSFLKQNGKFVMDYGLQHGYTFPVFAETPTELSAAIQQQRMVVNALPAFFDLSRPSNYNPQQPEETQQLGHVSARDLYHVPLKVDESIHVQQLILGAQCQLQEDSTTAFDVVLERLLPRLPVFSERLWTRDLASFSNVLERLDRFHMPLWDSLHMKYDETIWSPNFKVVANQTGIGLILQTELDSVSYSYAVENPFSVSSPSEVRSNDTLSMSRSSGTDVMYFFRLKDHQNNTKIRLPITSHGALGFPVRLNNDHGFPDSTLLLTDGLVGTTGHAVADWYVNDQNIIELELDLTEKLHVQTISIGFFEDQNKAYYIPQQVELYCHKYRKRWLKCVTVSRDDLYDNRMYLHPDMKMRRIKLRIYAHQMPCSTATDFNSFRLTAMDEVIVITGN